MRICWFVSGAAVVVGMVGTEVEDEGAIVVFSEVRTMGTVMAVTTTAKTMKPSRIFTHVGLFFNFSTQPIVRRFKRSTCASQMRLM